MKYFSRVLIVLALLSAFIGCAVIKEVRTLQKGIKSHNPADYGLNPAQHVKKNIAYAPGVLGESMCRLDVHWNDSSAPKPVVMVIHGGGWFMGSKDDDMQDLFSGYVANQGYVAVNVNYRMLPTFTVEDCINDTFGAVVWAKEHASEFGGDPERVGAIGFSAGGHLTAMAATAGNRLDIFKPTGHENSSYDASVKAAVPFYGAYDMLTIPVDVFPVPLFLNRLFSRMVFQGKPADNIEFGRMISPITYISDQTPPQLVVCGEADSLKLYPQSVEYVEALKKAGRLVEFLSVPGADHAFNAAYWTDESVNAHKAAIEHFDKYLK